MKPASMARSVFGWFGPPDLARPDLARRARSLWIVSWPFFAVVAVVLGIGVLVEPHTLARRATTVAAVGVLVAILHVISRSGRPVLASWVLVLGLSVIVTQRAWITGGIHAPVAVFYVLFIVMAGVLIGVRGGLVTAAGCLLGASILTAGTELQWLTPRPGAGSPLGAFVFVLLAIGLAIVLQALVARHSRAESIAPHAVQMLVHDLRSPIQVVLGNLELLKAEVRGESARDLEGAIDGASTVDRMTTSLLDLTRLEAGVLPVQRSRTDLSALADAAVSSLRALQPNRILTVEVEGDPICQCDAELTRRILENLISNALKHTAVEGPVRVVITGLRDRVRMAVSDAGPGVAASERSRIFEPYSAGRLRSAAGFASSGLGLAFCRLAAEAQGGTIRLEDGVSGGSVFVVELPRE